MKYCKYCRTEIDAKAKVCPNCRREQKRFHIWKVLTAVILVIVLLIIGASYLASNNNYETPTFSSSKDNFSYEVTNSYPTEYDLWYYIEGTVKNNSNKDYSYVQIEFICYDKDGNNIGTAMDNTSNLGAYETWKFKAMSLFSDVRNLDHCNYKEITAY